jgi:hypothetical protein
MKVKDLITKLQEFDIDKDVAIAKQAGEFYLRLEIDEIHVLPTGFHESRTDVVCIIVRNLNHV